MVINQTIQGPQLITQTQHAHLAYAIACRLKEKYRSPYFMEALQAIALHETEKTDFNYTRQLDTLGSPISFDRVAISDENILNKIEDMLDSLKFRSTLVAALVSSHFENLYPKLYKNVSSAHSGLPALARGLYQIPEDVYDHLYQILKFADRLSLMICQRELPDAGRTFQINNSLHNKNFYIREQEGCYCIEPWPFKGTCIELDIEYRILDKVGYKNSNAFLESAGKSCVLKQSIHFSKKSNRI